MDFALKYENKTIDYWQNVIFADESKFSLYKRDDKKMERVYRQVNKTYELKNLSGTVKHGGPSVMIWGCMSYNGVGNMEVIETTMNKEGYLSILKNHLRSSATKMGLNDF